MTRPGSRPGDVTGALLVGGASRRMGVDKTLLTVRGRPLVLLMLDTLQTAFKTVMVIGHGRPGLARLGIEPVEDIISGAGALGGIYTALKSTDTPFVFVAACDMPHLTVPVIRRILSERQAADAVIPAGPRGAEPLCAVYSRRCEEPFLTGLQQGRLRIRENLPGLNVAYPLIRQGTGGIDPFLNLNRPEDLAAIED